MSTPLAASLPAGQSALTTLTPEQIARRSGSSFQVSFLFLGRARRRAMTAVYAFCRVIDDAVDDAKDVGSGREALAFWQEELARAYASDGGKLRTKVGLGLREAAAEFGVREEYLQEILDGVAMDLEPPDYETVEALEAYCFKVASAVGLACLPILGGGFEREQDHDYAKHLGIALQLTNILRDLRKDAESGRVYVPKDVRAEAGIADDVALPWLQGKGPADAYTEGGPVAQVVDRVAVLADTHFTASAKVLPGPVVAEIMAAVYLDLLRRVRQRGGDVRLPRLRVPRLRKLWLAVRTRWRGRR